jgi:uncharacterized phiE125 gp8 family phage protein
MLAEPIITMSEAQAFVRIETGEEEALLAGLIRTASALCEAFINQVAVARDFELDVPASSAWVRLPVTPVRAITNVAIVDAAGATPIPSDQYAADIDFNGDGWVRMLSGDATRLRVAGRAGMGESQNGIPEPIRQGVLRLIAHMFTARDNAAAGEPPAAVTALWRPYRRMRLA